MFPPVVCRVLFLFCAVDGIRSSCPCRSDTYAVSASDISFNKSRLAIYSPLLMKAYEGFQVDTST